MSQPPVVARRFWVVIPAYNEGATVRDVAARALQHCPNVIVVDDGSTDDTGEALVGLNVMVLRHDQNRGKAESLWRGFQQALAQGAEAVITLDADGQHPPEHIPSCITAALRAPDDLVIGARRAERRTGSRSRYIANRVADFWISWAAGEPIADSQSGFRVYPARYLRTLTIPHGRNQSFVFESEVLIEAVRKGVQCLHIPIDVTARTGARASHFRPVVDILRITKMVARKLLARGLYPLGFYRAFIRRGRPDMMSDRSVVPPLSSPLR